jgi:hypothetical protein
MMTLIYFGLVTPTRFNCVIRHRQPNKFHDVERVWRLLPEFGRSRGNIFRGFQRVLGYSQICDSGVAFDPNSVRKFRRE